MFGFAMEAKFQLLQRASGRGKKTLIQKIRSEKNKLKLKLYISIYIARKKTTGIQDRNAQT